MGYFSRLLSVDNRPVVLTAGGGSSSLLTNLAAYWKLDEASGGRVDSGPNGQDLTDNNSVGSSSGKIGNAADFEYDSQTYLSRADSATLSLGTDTDFTLCCWVNLESKPAFDGAIISKNGSGADLEYELYYASSGFDRFVFQVGNGVSGQDLADSSFGAPSLSTWYFVVVWHDSAADLINIQVNNGTVDSTTWAGGTFNGSTEFRIGARSFNAGFAFDGLIDEVGFWKRMLTPSERTELYNSGNGKTYPFS